MSDSKEVNILGMLSDVRKRVKELQDGGALNTVSGVGKQNLLSSIELLTAVMRNQEERLQHIEQVLKGRSML